MILAAVIVVGSELMRVRRAVLYRPPAPPPAPLPSPASEDDAEEEIILVRPRDHRGRRAD